MALTLNLENKKENLETTIKKHIEVAKKPMHLIELNKGLTLNQQRMFNLAILHVENGISVITKNQYETIFSNSDKLFYYKENIEDIEKLLGLRILTETEEKLIWDNVFMRVEFIKEDNTFLFKWSPYMKERIENVQRNYIKQDLKTLANFQNKYSFILYDFFKSSYKQWNWTLTFEELTELLRIQKSHSYFKNRAMFFKHCIEGAIKELNEFTEYKIEYEKITGARNKLEGVKFRRFKEKNIVYDVTTNQIETLQNVVNDFKDMKFWMNEITRITEGNSENFKSLLDAYLELSQFETNLKNIHLFNSETISPVVQLAIQKSNNFKHKYTYLLNKNNAVTETKNTETNIENIEDFTETPKRPKTEFYNWLEERED